MVTASIFASMDTGHQDPRNATDFTGDYYPTADGFPAPPADSTSPQDRIRLDFLSAYYRLNCAYAQLLKARTAPSSQQDEELERKLLQQVEEALVNRDRLEDTYAPSGVIVEPVVREGFAQDLRFSFAVAAQDRDALGEQVLIEAILPLDLPPGFDLKDLPIRLRVARGVSEEPEEGIVPPEAQAPDRPEG